MSSSLTRNITLYRWSRFLRSLLFWQAIWFLYYQEVLSAAEAILLYATFDIATTLLEVPSGYMSDRIGRRLTLLAGAACVCAAALLQTFHPSFTLFFVANILLGAGTAFTSGTDEAMLYESLAELDRADEVEAQEIIAWRYSFTGLALSAVIGGAFALVDFRISYVAVAVAQAGLFAVTCAMVEPTHRRSSPESQLGNLNKTIRHPVFLWLFALSVAMYVFGHLPFIFGQPFILNALDRLDVSSSAPLVTGTITAVMLAISVAVSFRATQLRRYLGLPALLLMCFGLQIAISGVMAMSASLWVVIALLARMIPSALSRPFILARTQPLLPNTMRATWLSLQSFVGRFAFAAALAVSAINANSVGAMSYQEIQAILARASCLGLILLAVLAVFAQRIPIESSDR